MGWEWGEGLKGMGGGVAPTSLRYARSNQKAPFLATCLASRMSTETPEYFSTGTCVRFKL